MNRASRAITKRCTIVKSNYVTVSVVSAYARGYSLQSPCLGICHVTGGISCCYTVLFNYLCDYILVKEENMTIDKSKLVICVVCNQTITPKYLGKALNNPNEDVYW